jgi:ATP phosphoribosyltransferase regulatory subunit HisZ
MDGRERPALRATFSRWEKESVNIAALEPADLQK